MTKESGSTFYEYIESIGLTYAQIQDKKNYIGGSSAKDIADGNWNKVYEQMVLGKRDDLSKVFKVQLGHITEEFNLRCFAEFNDLDIMTIDTPYRYTNPSYDFIGCLPDAIMSDKNGSCIVIDAKHTGAKTPWWDEQKIAEYYFPQAQHNMIATNIHEFNLSVIFGNEGPVRIPIEYNIEWATGYIDLCKVFWEHVQQKNPPRAGIGIEVPDLNIKLDDMRELDMTQGNTGHDWKFHAEAFIGSQLDHGLHEISKKYLKEMVPEDVKLAFGNNIEIKRNKRGAMKVKVTNEK